MSFDKKEPKIMGISRLCDVCGVHIHYCVCKEIDGEKYEVDYDE